MHADSNVYLRFYLLWNSIQFHHRFAFRSFTNVTRMCVHGNRKSEFSSYALTVHTTHCCVNVYVTEAAQLTGLAFPYSLVLPIDHRVYTVRLSVGRNIIYSQFICFTRFIFGQMSSIYFRAGYPNSIDRLSIDDYAIFVRNAGRWQIESMLWNTRIKHDTRLFNSHCIYTWREHTSITFYNTFETHLINFDLQNKENIFCFFLYSKRCH